MSQGGEPKDVRASLKVSPEKESERQRSKKNQKEKCRPLDHGLETKRGGRRETQETQAGEREPRRRKAEEKTEQIMRTKNSNK